MLSNDGFSSEANSILEESIKKEKDTSSTNLEDIDLLKERVQLLEDQLLRAAAESDNIRKRFEKLIDDTRDYSITSFAKDLLIVMDNLLRALTYKPQVEDIQVSNLIAGVEITKSELSNIFKRHGLEIINPNLGEKFDYNLHYAISQESNNEYEQNSIISVMQTGYKINGRLLRPAAVVVAMKN